MAIEKTGSAHWAGGLRDGTGSVSTQTGALANHPYGFNARFEGGQGTNPEELIAAAHASCFAMALSLNLGEQDLTAEAIDVTATVTLEQVDGGFAITKSHLVVRASVPGATEDQFMDAARATETGCPVSKVLDTTITMDAALT